MQDALSLFHPLIAGWFIQNLGRPTDIQSQAWPEIAAGNHILATAPTGSGKTLAAFLWSINQLVRGEWKRGTTRVIYISPLKALNNDIRRNLLKPLSELKEHFVKNGADFPDIRVMTRSGDSTSEERRKLYRNPPEILITTPESLNIMLTSKSGRTLFDGIRTVILDEIHSIADSKRGTHLITAIERITLQSGEFQRIALSATVRPLEVIADFIGGYQLQRNAAEAVYRKRPVRIIRSEDKKSYAVSVEFPRETPVEGEEEVWWQLLARELKEKIRKNRSTLLFANSRRVAEKMTRFLNEGEDEIIAYSHHGSISKEIRLEVEERMKKGELRAIVATNSLELGIDIGELDEVVLIQTPFSISSSLQRIGRAGHKVGEVSRGQLFPTHGMDFLTSAVMAKSISEAAIEAIHPVECPLDILAQIILSMVTADEWDIDELFNFIKCANPYRNLSRKQYDLILQMLSGRYADSRLKELSPRVSIDKIDNTIRAKSGTAYLLYTSGGTIPDRGYYDMRVQDSRAKIGELDEEFVWERNIGDTFTLGTQVWRIQNITHNDVEVVPLPGKHGMVPFWKGEEFDRDFYYSRRILDFLKDADVGLADPGKFHDTLVSEYSMSAKAAQALVDYLLAQRDVSAGKLPHRERMVIEHYHDGSAREDSHEIILHNFWGGKLNRPLSMALAAAWEEKFRAPLEVFVSDANILLILPNSMNVMDVLRMVTPENLESLLRKRLESSGFFGAKFRENAARALLLPRGNFHKRYPLWLNRLRSKKLLETVMGYPDFPILLETWRECMQDSFDLENLKTMLSELHSGRIELVEVEHDSPSPFCDGLIWRQTNKYMYEDDTPEGRAQSNLSRKVLDEVLYSSILRPKIPVRLAQELESRLQRTKTGYAPGSPEDLLDWLKERLLIPEEEWKVLLEACIRDSAGFPADLPGNIQKKIAFVRLDNTEFEHACAVENIPLLESLFEMVSVHGNEYQGKIESEALMDLADFLAQWLSYYGPVEPSFVEEMLGFRPGKLNGLLQELSEDDRIIIDKILEGSGDDEICYTDNLERLLRMARLDRQPSFQALSADYLPLFLASWQGIAAPGALMEDLQFRIERLFGYSADAQLWEEEILPARMENYQSAWLDSLLHSSPLLWLGAGKHSVTFTLDNEISLYIEPSLKDMEKAGLLFADERGRYSLFDIARHSGISTEEAAKRLWELTWKSAVVNDSMETLRKGILNGFEPSGFDKETQKPGLLTRRSGMSRWAASRPVQGSWRLLDLPQELEALERQELEKDRARVLFDRYGIIFRELLENELPPLRWKNMFPTLRLMELSGEILSGYFFEGIQGVQFISFEAFRFLREGLQEDSVYWMNAKDPASLSGIGLESLKGKFPKRMASNHFVFHGRQLVLESLKNGKELRFHIPPDHSRFIEALRLFKSWLSRDFNPVKSVFVETINGKSASASEYKDALREFGFSAGYKGLELWKRY